MIDCSPQRPLQHVSDRSSPSISSIALDHSYSMSQSPSAMSVGTPRRRMVSWTLLRLFPASFKNEQMCFLFRIPMAAVHKQQQFAPNNKYPWVPTHSSLSYSTDFVSDGRAHRNRLYWKLLGRRLATWSIFELSQVPASDQWLSSFFNCFNIFSYLSIISMYRSHCISVCLCEFLFK